MDIQFPDAIRGGKAGGGHISIEQRNTHHKPGGWGEGRNSVPSIQSMDSISIQRGTFYRYCTGLISSQAQLLPSSSSAAAPPLYLLASCERSRHARARGATARLLSSTRKNGAAGARVVNARILRLHQYRRGFGVRGNRSQRALGSRWLYHPVGISVCVPEYVQEVREVQLHFSEPQGRRLLVVPLV